MTETILTTCEGYRILIEPDTDNIYVPEGVDFE